MKILVAEDESPVAEILRANLTHWGYDVVLHENGEEALRALLADVAPPMALLDWMLPSINGVEICRLVRELHRPVAPYLILLTARSRPHDVVTALEAGANDYITKPFHVDELRARLLVGKRTLELEQTLADRVAELERALSENAELQRMLPICAYCKKIRDDTNYWQQLEGYLQRHRGVHFSHSICPECFKTKVEPMLPPAPAP